MIPYLSYTSSSTVASTKGIWLGGGDGSEKSEYLHTVNSFSGRFHRKSRNRIQKNSKKKN